MAKKKAKETDGTETTEDAISSALALLKNDFGDDIFIEGQDFLNEKQVIIPFSPTIDMMLGGGVPEGSVMILTGLPKCGKTVSSLDFAATAQDPKYACKEFPEGRHVFFFSIEGRIKQRDIEGVRNICIPRFHLIRSAVGKIQTGEQFLEKAEKVIKTVPGAIVIIDSFSALCSTAESSSEMDKMQRADAAKLIAKFCRKVSNDVAVNKVIVVGITHLGGNPTGMGAALQEKSGNSLKYAHDIKLFSRHFEYVAPAEGAAPTGQKIEWICQASAIGPPGVRGVSYLRYGYGIDKEMEVASIATDMGIITKNGAWYSFDFLQEPVKLQGLEKVRQALLDSKDLYNNTYEQIKTLLGLKY
jgi:recombination protein RecA